MAKKTAKSSASKSATATKAAPKKPMTKAQLIERLAEATELDKKSVSAVLESLNEVIEQELAKKGPGVFVLPPSLLKIERKRVAAKKARKGINPSTGEEIDIAAKPAHDTVKVRPLKALKEMI